eukprot:12621293-Alexandrium_andersonii.AAC.1
MHRGSQLRDPRLKREEAEGFEGPVAFRCRATGVLAGPTGVCRGISPVRPCRAACAGSFVGAPHRSLSLLG